MDIRSCAILNKIHDIYGRHKTMEMMHSPQIWILKIDISEIDILEIDISSLNVKHLEKISKEKYFSTILIGSNLEDYRLIECSNLTVGQ